MKYLNVHWLNMKTEKNKTSLLRSEKVYGMRYVLSQKDKIENIVDNARKQGKSEEKIKQIVSLFIDRMCKRIREKGLTY